VALDGDRVVLQEDPLERSVGNTGTVIPGDSNQITGVESHGCIVPQGGGGFHQEEK